MKHSFPTWSATLAGALGLLSSEGVGGCGEGFSTNVHSPLPCPWRVPAVPPQTPMLTLPRLPAVVPFAHAWDFPAASTAVPRALAHSLLLPCGPRVTSGTWPGPEPEAPALSTFPPTSQHSLPL